MIAHHDVWVFDLTGALQIYLWMSLLNQRLRWCNHQSFKDFFWVFWFNKSIATALKMWSVSRISTVSCKNLHDTLGTLDTLFAQIVPTMSTVPQQFFACQFCHFCQFLYFFALAEVAEMAETTPNWQYWQNWQIKFFCHFCHISFLIVSAMIGWWYR